jgi:hypothetical protein
VQTLTLRSGELSLRRHDTADGRGGRTIAWREIHSRAFRTAWRSLLSSPMTADGLLLWRHLDRPVRCGDHGGGRSDSPELGAAVASACRQRPARLHMHPAGSARLSRWRWHRRAARSRWLAGTGPAWPGLSGSRSCFGDLGAAEDCRSWVKPATRSPPPGAARKDQRHESRTFDRARR